MDGERKLHELQAKSRKLRTELEVLSAQIHAQIAQNERERERNSITDEDEEDEAM